MNSVFHLLLKCILDIFKRVSIDSELKISNRHKKLNLKLLIINKLTYDLLWAKEPKTSKEHTTTTFKNMLLSDSIRIKSLFLRECFSGLEQWSFVWVFRSANKLNMP